MACVGVVHGGGERHGVKSGSVGRNGRGEVAFGSMTFHQDALRKARRVSMPVLVLPIGRNTACGRVAREYRPAVCAKRGGVPRARKRSPKQ